MAEKGTKEIPTDTTNNGEAQKSSKKKLYIILAMILLLVLGGVGGFIYYKKNHNQESDSQETEEVSESEGSNNKQAKDNSDKKYYYEPIDMFTSNIKSIGVDGKSYQDRFIQVQFAFQIEDDEYKSEKTKMIKDYMPNIKHTILMTLTESNDQTLLTVKGKIELTEDIRKKLNTFLSKEIKSTGSKIKKKEVIDQILITSFIIQ